MHPRCHGFRCCQNSIPGSILANLTHFRPRIGFFLTPLFFYEEERGQKLLCTHPSTEERVQTLLEMEQKMRPYPVREPVLRSYRPAYGRMAV